jgi:hypothetical protein
MVNPFEETAQAARDWNPREQYISSFNEDRTRNAPIEFLLNEERNKQQRWEDVGGQNAYPTINTNRSPASPNPYNPGWIEAGITNQNLDGYKVWNAGWEKLNPFYWWQRGSDWEHGTDHAKKYEKQKPPFISEEGYGPLENAEKEWNRSQIRMNEPSGRAAQDQYFDSLTEQGLYPWNFRTQPMTEYGDLLYDDVGNQLWGVTAENVEEMEPIIEAQSQWKRPENMEKTIQALKLRPEFEGWTDEAIKTWIYNTARANRGGIIGLL